MGGVWRQQSTDVVHTLYLTMNAVPVKCPICDLVSQIDLRQYYGGKECCYHCRNFFRRASKTSNFICSCSASTSSKDVNSKKSCNKCRYQCCIQNGMVPALASQERRQKKSQ